MSLILLFLQQSFYTRSGIEAFLLGVIERELLFESSQDKDLGTIEENGKK